MIANSLFPPRIWTAYLEPSMPKTKGQTQDTTFLSGIQHFLLLTALAPRMITSPIKDLDSQYCLAPTAVAAAYSESRLPPMC